ncbi:MAG TPA: sigma factor [Parapedobacter sp.]|uniref:RNA polymerase sigma factor n=1 Tax=Parapedobacter sp. TaxID=1958893 RepID=UPI002B53DA47|nr:sigma factor [Parapedobacter sp.]HWK57476.1 sigma factor [Parapedobacter sp.]
MNTKIPAKLDEKQVLLRLKNDDHQAFTQIYQHYIRKLLAIAYNYCRDKALAEEIVQEVFVRLWERRRTKTVAHIS